MTDPGAVPLAQVDAATPAAAAGRHTLAIVLTWPEVKNAEYEIVQRLRLAARNIGAGVLVVDNDGYQLWSDAEGSSTVRDRRIGPEDCDFVISLHFESPRLYDVFSYVTLWNPPEFYRAAGYERTVQNLASHSDVLSCRSAIADAHAQNAFAGFGRALHPPFPALFHGVPEPFLKPNISASSRAFYVGINWERVTGERGRFHELLERLDAEDLISIYGPREFLGVSPWEGFKTYVEEIPFDGRSVVQRINAAGICLALSSDAHRKSGIMSNRLFEGLAAGAVIIANRHPLIDSHFADCIHVLAEHETPEALAAEVRDLIVAIRADPAAARARAEAGQRRLTEQFALERSLAELLEAHPRRLAAWSLDLFGPARHHVSVVVDYPGLDAAELRDLMGNVGRQERCDIDLSIVCDSRVAAAIATLSPADIAPHVRSLKLYPDDLYLIGNGLDQPPARKKGSGASVAKALGEIETEFFCLMQPDDHWFAGHLASLAHALVTHPPAPCAWSGKILETKPGGKPALRRLEQLCFTEMAAAVAGHLPRDVGRVLYRKNLLEEPPLPLFGLLDGAHNRFFNIRALLRGEPAQSGHASYVRQQWRQLPEPFYSDEQQTLFIRDAFRGDPLWRKAVGQWQSGETSLFPAEPFARPPVRIVPGHRYETGAGGDGLALLRDGFADPETSFTWINGEFGSLEWESAGLSGGWTLLLVAGGRSSRLNERQVLTVLWNGEELARRTLAEELRPVEIPLLPAHLSAGRVSLAFALRHAEPVIGKEGVVLDSRKLGFRLAAVGIIRREAAGSTFEGRPRNLQRRLKTVGRLLGLGRATPKDGVTAGHDPDES